MTSIVLPAAPPPTYPPAGEVPTRAAVPPPTRMESMDTVDMHIPGAWNGTNPSTPRPITEDMGYLGQQLKTVPGTVQGYIPSKDATIQTASGLKDKAAAIIPASVMNTATNILPASLQPTANPTAADAAPPVPSADAKTVIPTTTNTTEHIPHDAPTDGTVTGGSTLMDKAAAILPAGALSAAAAYLPSSLNPTAAPTAADAQPPATTTTDKEIAPSAVPPTVAEEKPAQSTWTEKILPAGAIAAAGAYMPTTLNPFSNTTNETAPTPSGTHEGLNGPLPPIPSSTQPTSEGPLVGSTVSPDADVQQALSKATNPEQYKVDVVPPTDASNDTAFGTNNVISSTTAVGGATPLSPTPEPSKRGERAAEGLGALGLGAGALAVDHGLKDQKQAAMVPNNNGSRLIETNDSFQHVVIPATPFAGEHEQEKWDQDTTAVATGTGAGAGMAALDTKKKHKKDRSGSISAGEASPSSPSKSGRFSGIRKLTKKRDRSAGKGHSRDVSMDDSKAAPIVPPVHEDSLDSQNSNSTGPSPTSPTKKERNVLHKDPPATLIHDNHANNDAPTAEDTTVNTTTAYDTVPSKDEVPATTNANEGSGSTPPMMANPYSPNAPSSSSPIKASFKDKIKGEFMSVSGTLTRDHGLKEAGEKLKKGTL